MIIGSGRSARRLLALFLLIASSGAAAAGGERFVAPYAPPAAEWELVPDPSHPTAKIWKNRKNEKDKLRIESLVGAPESLAEIRMALDAPGKASCAVFDTTTLHDRPVGGYARLVWRTDCTKADGSKGTFLNLAVRGREALHLAMKIWQFEVPESEVAPWLARFEGAHVCDPSAGRPCPAETKPARQ